MKNDVSFLIKDVLNLYEHQSTYSFLFHSLLYFIMVGRKNRSSRYYICTRHFQKRAIGARRLWTAVPLC